MSAGIAFEGVSCARGGRTLFSDLSFALGPGEAAQVIGPNGAGKSSLVRVAAGLLAPVAGAVRCEGVRALLTEANALDIELPLSQALNFWAKIDGRRGAVDAALAAFDLAMFGGVPVRLLSTGQRKRAGLARVLVSGAEVWLLDEPANGLDAASVAMLEGAMAIHRAQGGIVLVATHLPIALDDARKISLSDGGTR